MQFPFEFLNYPIVQSETQDYLGGTSELINKNKPVSQAVQKVADTIQLKQVGSHALFFYFKKIFL